MAQNIQAGGTVIRLLAILWAEPPTAEDWQRLSDARIALGYTDLIQPAQALEGSPGPILAIGATPDWLTDFAQCDSTENVEDLRDALHYCLTEPQREPGEAFAELLSEWMDADLVYVGEEDFEG